jgi:hypothetical protein
MRWLTHDILYTTAMALWVIVFVAAVARSDDVILAATILLLISLRKLEA